MDKIKENDKSKETDKELRSRLLAEVRNPEPMKTVDGLKAEKTKAFDEQKAKANEAIDSADQAVNSQRTVVQNLRSEISDAEQERANMKADDRGSIDAKISELQTKLKAEEAKIQPLEENRETLKKNLAKTTDQHALEIKTLDKMTAETVQRAQKAALKIDDLGSKLMDIGEKEVGQLAKLISVRHDDSLGMKLGLEAGLMDKLELALDDKGKEQLEKLDNPAFAIQALNAAIKMAEQRAEQAKKKVS